MSTVDERPDPGASEERGLSILFVIFQTGKRANGGVESITRVIEGLGTARVSVVTQMHTPVVERWRAAGATVEVWECSDRRGVLGRMADVLRFNHRVDRLLRGRSIDVVHCNDLLAMWHAAIAARVVGVPVVFNVRDVKAPNDRYRWPWRISALADVVLVLSREMRDEIRARLPTGAPATTPPRVEWIYSIVDLERFRPVEAPARSELRRDLGIGQNQVAIGYVAAVTSKKAQADLIREAVPRVRDRLPRARLHLVGDYRPDEDEYAARCRDLVRDLDADDIVRFEGFQGAVEKWYQAVDILIVASKREGLARCMIEGMACGAPVVSFDVASAREILEDGAGRVVRRGDYQALVDAVAELAADGEEWRRMSEAGARRAGRLFTRDDVVSRYVTLYSGVRDSCRPAGLEDPG